MNGQPWASNRRWHTAAALFLSLLAWTGCGGEPASPPPAAEPEGGSPIAAVRDCLRQGQWDQTVATANEVLRADPKDSEALYCRGMAYRYRGDASRAIEDLTAAITHNAGHGEACLARGQLFLEKGLVEVALADLTRAVQLAPQSAEAFRQRANAYLVGNMSDRAIEDAVQAVRLDPVSPASAAAYRTLGMAHLERSDAAQAVACLEESLRRDATLASQVGPDLAEAWFRRGIALGESGRSEEAQKAFAQAKKTDPKYVAICQKHEETAEAKNAAKAASRDRRPPVNPQAAAEHCRLGQEHVKNGQWDEALREFAAAIAADRTCIEAYRGHGRAFLYKGFPDAAIEDYSEAIRLSEGGRSESDVESYSQRCLAYTLMHDSYRALADGNTAVRLAPESAEAYRNRGLAYLENRSGQRAVADLCEAIRLDPTMEAQLDRELAKAYQYWGREALRRGDHQQAERALERARQIDPNLDRQTRSLRAELNREEGLARLRSGDIEGAIARLQAAIEMDPTLQTRAGADLARAFRLRGLAMLRENHHEAAMDDFRTAVQLDPTLTTQVRDDLAATRIPWSAARPPIETQP